MKPPTSPVSRSRYTRCALTHPSVHLLAQLLDQLTKYLSLGEILEQNRVHSVTELPLVGGNPQPVTRQYDKYHGKCAEWSGGRAGRTVVVILRKMATVDLPEEVTCRRDLEVRAHML